MFKLILFDFDGTLAAIGSKSKAIINRLSEKYHFGDMTFDDFWKMRDLNLKDVLKKLNIPMWKLPFLVADYKNWMQEYIQDEELTHLSWKRIIGELKAQVGRLGILTSNSTENAGIFLKLHDIADFDFIYSASMFGKHRSLIKIINREKILPREVLYIGDEIRDVEACRRAGVPVMSVTWGINSKEALLETAPDYCVDSPEEIFSALGMSLGDAYAAC
ncbi:MAG: HAD-IA family hydrolase [Spirochaetales bacterium]|nr:HAD-IA family hydrolase [Spirochaetales bacterium]